MAQTLRIALVLPRAWPARDDVAWHVAAESRALADRGHAVTVLAPTADRDLLAEGRALLHALASGRPDAVLAAPGDVRVVAVGRALPAGPGRRIAGPIDAAASLETALGLAPFDVVHLHEPLAPSPALSALRHARGITAATFHGHEQLAGVAFLQPLVDRALSRVDVCFTTTEVARRALAQLLPREYALLPGGVDTRLFSPPAAEPPGPPGLVIVARERDRAGVRFALRALRLARSPALGPIAIVGPADAPWRTRAALPKALRTRVTIVPDEGPASRAGALAQGRIALIATPEEVAGPVVAEALACGMAVLAPRCDELDRLLAHGREGIGLPPFAAEEWARTVDELVADPGRRAALGACAARRARARTWDAVAAELEERYRSAIAARSVPARARGRAQRLILADLRVRPGPSLDPGALVAACRERGLGAVGVAAPGGIAPALAVAAVAPPELQVVVGQEIATEEGVIVGLCLTRDVPDGLPLAAAAVAVHAQGGLVLAPHPASASAAAAEDLRRHSSSIDCYELLTAAAPGAGARTARLAQRMGILVVAASGAATPEEVGLVAMRLRPFDGCADLLDALAEAELIRRRRTLLSRPGLHSRSPRRAP